MLTFEDLWIVKDTWSNVNIYTQPIFVQYPNLKGEHFILKALNQKRRLLILSCFYKALIY